MSESTHESNRMFKFDHTLYEQYTLFYLKYMYSFLKCLESLKI